jgi:hypothetical protein
MAPAGVISKRARHCERSEAIQSQASVIIGFSQVLTWIASLRSQ